MSDIVFYIILAVTGLAAVVLIAIGLWPRDYD
jgi:hypothetical protein